MRARMLMLLVPALVAAMVGVGLAALGHQQPSDRPPRSAQQPPDTAVVADPSPSPPSPSPSDPPTPVPTPSETPTASRPNYDVAAVQRRLTELRYYVGPVDGRAGSATRHAVVAFQKVNGLTPDGVVGPRTLAALAAPASPALSGGAANRIEVDLTRQVLYYVSGGQLQRIMPVSSGNGSRYRTSSGSIARSLTPVGTYHIQRRIRGLREADLGSLYDPLYFYKGWAIHGSNSVPAYPASHGCIRVPRGDALWLFGRAPVGLQVVVYGGTHTFPAGSTAPGTDTPAGDTASAPQAPTTPEPSPEPSSGPSRAAPESGSQPSPQPAPTPPPSSPTPPPSSPTPTPSPSDSDDDQLLLPLPGG